MARRRARTRRTCSSRRPSSTTRWVGGGKGRPRVLLHMRPSAAPRSRPTCPSSVPPRLLLAQGYESETNRFAGNINITNFDLMDTLLPPYARGLTAGKSVGTMCSYTSM